MESLDICYDCGKRLSPTRTIKLMVNFNNSTGRVIHPHDEPEGEDWGLQGVGSCCAKKLPKAYIITQRRTKP